MNVSIGSSITIGIDGRFLQDKFHGIGRYTHGLITGLCELEGDHQITLFIDPSLPNTRLLLTPWLHSPKLHIEHVSIPMYHPQELWAWPAQLRRTSVDVFHSPYFWAPLILSCPLITTVHDMIFDRYPEYIPGRRFSLPYKIMSRLTLLKSRSVIAVSEATRRDILEFTHTPSHKAVTVLSGVESAFTIPVTEQERAQVRVKYSLPDSYILALGARRPHKNIQRLVSAFSHAATDIPHALVLVGAIDNRFFDDASSAIMQLKQVGRVIEIAQVDEADLRALYAAADMFIQPSIIEGFGLPVIEALACGCPVACSNTSSLPEVAGDAAIFFDPLSEAEMADAIRCMLTSPELRKQLSQRGHERVQHFNWQTTAAKTLDVYRNAVAKERVLMAM